MIGELIADKAESWIDVPFHWQGTVRAGCDCKGLIVGVARECGRPEATSLEALSGGYHRKVPHVELQNGLARLFDRVRDRRRGDVLLLRMGGLPQHLAIYAPLPQEPDRIIEAMPTGPARVRPGLARAGRIISVWRWRSLGDERDAPKALEHGGHDGGPNGAHRVTND